MCTHFSLASLQWRTRAHLCSCHYLQIQQKDTAVSLLVGTLYGDNDHDHGLGAREDKKLASINNSIKLHIYAAMSITLFELHTTIQLHLIRSQNCLLK